MSVHHIGNFRGNPFTMAHAAFADHVMNAAENDKAGHTLILTRSHDGEKNPISPEKKLKHAKRAAPGANFKLATKESPTILHQASELSKKGVSHLIVHASSDRVGQFDKLLNTYNDKKGPHGHFKFKKIEVRQFSGDRSDKGGSGLEGVSATKMRKFAKENSAASKKSFFSMAPTNMSDEHKEDMWNDTKKGLQMESTTPVGIFLIGSPGSGKDYVLTNIFSRFDLTEVQVEHILNGSAKELLEQKKNIIINGPLDSENIATVSTLLEDYHLESVYVAVTNKVSRLRNSQREHPISENKRIDKWLRAEKLSESLNCFKFNNSINLNESSDFEKVFFADQIEKLLSKLIDTGLEMKNISESKSFPRVAKDRKTGLPKKYVKGLSDSTAAARKAHWARANKLSDKDPEAYKPAPGDATAKTKPSKYTLAVRNMMRQSVGSRWSPRLDEKSEQKNEEVENDKPLPKKLRRIARRGNRTEVMAIRKNNNEKTLEESKADKSISAKAEKSGISPSTLKKVYRRGVAAWNSGHRPGTTPQQWGHARVNSYISKGKGTYHGADKDLREETKETERQDVAEGSSDYSRRREREEAIISGQKPARRKKPAQTSDYALRRKQERDRSLGENFPSTTLDVNALFEMQLVGTDAYRRYAIAMTPGQNQEIEDAFPVKNPAEKDVDAETYTDCGCKSGRGCNGCQSENESNGKRNTRYFREGYNKTETIDFKPKINTRKPGGLKTPARGRSSTDTGLPVTARLGEAVEYHLENSIPFTENVFRPGSEMFFEMLSEAKRLYSEGEYTPADEWEKDLLESDVGEKAIFEGREVILDYPFEEELNESQEHEMIRKELDGLKTKNLKDLRAYIQQTSKVIDVSGFATKERAITHILRSKHGDKRVDAALNLKEDSDKTDGKGVGKPWREGGGGAVYVRDGGSIKKLSFSKSGMKKRFMDPGATRSFVARHRCLTNKDKTSSSYWACRWPRFFSNSGKTWW